MIEQLGNHVNTIHSNLKVLRKMVKEAIAEDLMPQEKNPFNKIRLKVEKTFREFLLDDELAKIEELQFADSSMLDHHRKLYIFSAYRQYLSAARPVESRRAAVRTEEKSVVLPKRRIQGFARWQKEPG